ncbi:MAG: hypothetical protein LBR69_00545 [Endomicrobium sp.]|jgi:hypothetical protein|nr:hypothetical protein [Endomicrobium sp.]
MCFQTQFHNGNYIKLQKQLRIEWPLRGEVRKLGNGVAALRRSLEDWKFAGSATQKLGSSEVRQLGNGRRQNIAVIPHICIVILREAAESMDITASGEAAFHLIKSVA